MRSAENYRAMPYVGARAAEGQPCGECNKGGVTGRDRGRGGGGRKMWSINEKIQGTFPRLYYREIDCAARPTAGNLVTTPPAIRSTSLWRLKI